MPVLAPGSMSLPGATFIYRYWPSFPTCVVARLSATMTGWNGRMTGTLSSLVRGTNWLSAGGCWNAPASPGSLDAQPSAHDCSDVSYQRFAGRLALGRTLFYAASGGW